MSVVYLLPGLMCDEAVWEKQAPILLRHAEVRIPVFRGFTSLKTMAESVLVDAPERFSVVGHSMGGRVAFELMALAGNRIERFAVMDTGAHPVQPGEVEKRQILLEAARRKGLQAVADAWIGPMLHPAHQQDAALVRQINDMILRNTLEDYEGQVTALLGREDRTPLLQEIRTRTWLLCGEADAWSPVSQHEAMLEHLTNGVLRVIPGAGHMSTMEQPDAVAKLLVEWLTEDLV
jgi:pimeloyl-ACP methyl ester carboxylesterase